MLRGEKSYMNMKIMKYIGLGLLSRLSAHAGAETDKWRRPYPFRAITVMNLKRC